MRSLFVVALTLWLAVPAQASRYVAYHNARFGFTLDRPPGFQVKPAPENGDGREWKAPGGATLAAYGANNVSRLTPAQLADDVAKGLEVTYRHVSGSRVTVSGYRGSKIVYERDVVGKGSIDTLLWTYPKAQRTRWDDAVAATARSFTPGDVSRAY
jgi:hypothetical protein